ncbi:hypothetical protein BDZ89DRAFT_1132801 [Hymenopellis radicata]|nr:hypothetical protein BDZ89DRAFT_1132801 [Hymenopellis radicata]
MAQGTGKGKEKAIEPAADSHSDSSSSASSSHSDSYDSDSDSDSEPITQEYLDSFKSLLEKARQNATPLPPLDPGTLPFYNVVQ